MRKRSTYHPIQPRLRAFCQQMLVGLVLVGYLFVLYGSSAGHGWWLLVHLAEDHPTVPAAPAEIRILRTLNPDKIAQPHTNGNADHHHNADGTHSHPHQTNATHHEETTVAWNTPHEHHGKVHTHAQNPDQEKALLVILTLDQHCLFDNPVTPVPLPTRDARFIYAPAALVHPDLTIEPPPPRYVA